MLMRRWMGGEMGAVGRVDGSLGGGRGGAGGERVKSLKLKELLSNEKSVGAGGKAVVVVSFKTLEVRFGARKSHPV